MKHGVVVVASIGNEGALGLYGAAAPGVGKDVIGVASFDNTHANLAAFTISPDGARVGYIAATGAPRAAGDRLVPDGSNRNRDHGQRRLQRGARRCLQEA